MIPGSPTGFGAKILQQFVQQISGKQCRKGLDHSTSGKKGPNTFGEQNSSKASKNPMLESASDLRLKNFASDSLMGFFGCWDSRI